MSQEIPPPGVLKLCLVYVPEDEDLYVKLEKHFKFLEQRKLVELWSTQKILAGSDYNLELEKQLSQADLIIYLFSPDLLDSRYYSDANVQRLMERYKRNEVRIVPVILRPVLVDLLGPPFADLEPLPRDGKAVTEKRSRAAALLEIAENIKDAVLRMSGRLAPESDKSVSAEPHIACWTVPYSQNGYFTGRTELLTALHERLHMRERFGPAAQALTGLGGMGKTQVAVEYAYRYQQEYQAVLWVRADSRENLLSDGLALARTLALPEKDSSEQEVVLAALKRWLQREERWLLIFDNVTDLDLVRDFLPVQYRGHVLITTRIQATREVAVPLAVPALAIEEGANWLLRRVGMLSPDVEDQHRAREIARELDGLPLALDQVAAYIEETGESLEQYLHLYQRQRAALLRYRGRANASHPASVGATLSLAIKQVEQLYAPAAELLRLCAFLHPATIPEALLVDESLPAEQALLTEVADRYELNQALRMLLLFSLIRRNAAEQSLSVHRLVQVVLKDALTEQERRLWAERAVTLVSRAWPETGAANWECCQDYLPHALICADHIDQWKLCSGEAMRLLRGVGVYLSERASYQQAEHMLLRALSLCETLRGADDPETAAILQELGWLAHSLSRYAPAEEYYQRALTIREARLGPNHIQTAWTLSTLGLLCVDLRETERAAALLQRALQIREQQLGPRHPQVAETLNALGRLARQRRDYPRAEAYYRRALAIREQALGEDAPETAVSLANLGVLAFAQKHYAEAEPFYQRALDIRERVLGPEHPATAVILSNLALVCYYQARYDEAEPLATRALEIQEQMLGREHTESAQSIMTLAMLSLHRRDYQRAEALAAEALAIRERLLPAHAPNLISSLSDLARIYQEQKKDERAWLLLQRALLLSEQEYGPDHANTARMRNELAECSQRVKRPAENDASPA